MLAMLNAALPWFVSVTLCAPLRLPMISLPKVSDDAERFTIGAVAVPIPVSETICSALGNCPELSMKSTSA
jgi:hypothetical protein